MPAWKRTTKKGKFKELARKKQFQNKKGELKINILHMPLEKRARRTKKRELLFFEKVLK